MERALFHLGQYYLVHMENCSLLYFHLFKVSWQKLPPFVGENSMSVRTHSFIGPIPSKLEFLITYVFPVMILLTVYHLCLFCFDKEKAMTSISGKLYKLYNITYVTAQQNCVWNEFTRSNSGGQTGWLWSRGSSSVIRDSNSESHALSTNRFRGPWTTLLAVKARPKI